MKHLLAALFPNSGTERYDLEQVYRFLDWVNSAEENFLRVFGFFCGYDQWRSSEPSLVPGQLESRTQALNYVAQQLRDLRSVLNQAFHYEYHVQHQRGPEAVEVYEPLVRAVIYEVGLNPSVSSRNSKLAEVFTLNWDNAWEAMRENGMARGRLNALIGVPETNPLPLHDGFYRKGGRAVFLDTKKLEPSRTEPGISVMHLHGCISWRRDADQSSVKYVDPTPPMEATGESPCLLYPGEKDAQTYPWVDLVNHFRDTISKCDAVLVVGYSFRDEHINGVLLQALRDNARLRLVCVDPKTKEELKGLGEVPASFLDSAEDRLEVIQGEWPDEKIVSMCRERLIADA